MSGTLTDAYVAEIQHDLVEFPDQATLLGVVRKPLAWLFSVVDENRPELGPPNDLPSAVKERDNELQNAGMPAADAHNQAMDEVEFDRQYREYLANSAEAQSAIDDIRAKLAIGETVVLVCYENTAEKQCHRTLLRDWIRRSDS